MAELPPKIPTTAPSEHHTVLMGNSTQNQPWVEEFLNFSAAKRNAHRSLRDEIAFFEAPPLMVEKCDSSSVTLRSHNNDQFEGLDDEQLMTMFSDDHHHHHHHHHISGTSASTASNAVPHQTMSSTSSDRNSINDDDDQKPTHEQCHDQDDHHQQNLRNEAGEVESRCKPDIPIPTSSSGDPIRDPKRVKRILANRQSAQRSRVRKLQYISELERSVTSLETEVSALSPRVAYLDHQRLVLNVDNSALKQRIAALAQDKIFKDAHQEALKKEIERLRQVMYQQQQNLKKMSNNSTTGTNNINIDHAQILDCNKDKEESNKEKEIREEIIKRVE